MGKIFLVQDGEELMEMEESSYISEDILQDIIAKYPNLLSGKEMDIDEPRKWLLVQREQILPYDSTGQKFFYLDHLFLDQDGVPTIVETKRSSDNRLRREVVAQMLDYASNALIYLPVEEIVSNLIKNYPETELEELLADKLGVETDPIEFWQLVETNFQAGKIRLVFVADEIPDELITIVEFLNKQMNPAEVLALEVKQYIGDGLKTLAPRLVGQSAEVRMRKRFQTKNLNKTSFFEHLDPEHLKFYQKLLDFATEKQLIIKWSSKSVSLNINKDGVNLNLLRGYCDLSAFGQALFATSGNIKTNLTDGEIILNEYEPLEDFTTKVSDGYKFDIINMDDEQSERFYEVLSTIIEMINNDT